MYHDIAWFKEAQSEKNITIGHQFCRIIYTIMHNSSTSSRLGDGITPEALDQLNQAFEKADPDRLLQWGFDSFGTEMALGTGFGPSGVFLIHRLHGLGLEPPIFYLDTHLLFDETYALRDLIEKRLDIQITRVSTDLTLEEQEEKHGPELWKTNPNRCCYLRKVLPLRNYLADKKAWVTGVRRNQSETRKKTQKVEWDPGNEVVKINPLADWSDDQVWNYIYQHDLPYNPLHDEGYPSIGCIPCTQPVTGDGDQRAGRWSDSEKNECGIHLSSQKFQQ